MSAGQQSSEELRKLFENASATVDEDSGVWLKSVRDKLYSMFLSPLTEEYSREAFRWAANLCLSVGDFSWVCPGNNWTKTETTMFSCIVRLSINEIHLLLPIIDRHLTCGDDPIMEEGKILLRSANEIDYDSFGNHLILLESTIKTLVRNQDEEGNSPLTKCISGEELHSLLDRLKDIVLQICNYLENVLLHWPMLSDHKSYSDKFCSAAAALRMICVWLSEDPESLEAQCESYIIDLIIKFMLITESPVQIDVLMTGLHAVCTEKENLMLKFKSNPQQEEALQKYLNFVQEGERGSIFDHRSNRNQKILKLRCGLVKDLITSNLDS